MNCPDCNSDLKKTDMITAYGLVLICPKCKTYWNPHEVQSSEGKCERMRYKVNYIEVNMHKDQRKIEDFLNSLEGEVICIIPNVDSTTGGWSGGVNFLFIVEKTQSSRRKTNE